MQVSIEDTRLLQELCEQHGVRMPFLKTPSSRALFEAGGKYKGRS